MEGLFAFHALVIVSVMSDQIIAHDPRNAQSSLSISLRTFEEAWESADRECLVIELKKQM